MKRSPIWPWAISIALLTAIIAGGLLGLFLRKSGGGKDYLSRTASVAKWIVEPEDPGPNLPPVGRSLFDFMTTDEQGNQTVPFPFTALLRKIEDQLERDQGQASPLKRVLVPLGRSLQRGVAAPEFFKYPRAVVAAVGEPRVKDGHSGMLLKDRLYLGYQERANLIEVISYNEVAGRFEFQVIREYRPGGKPEVFYANRSLCVACHQNQSPIFSRQIWDETHANPQIALLLRDQRRDFYGFPLEQGVDVPNAIDDATDRANLFSAGQLLWREGCEAEEADKPAIRCRASAFMFVLQYLLSGGRYFDIRSEKYRQEFLPFVTGNGRRKWPQGLQIPDSDIVNRNPLSTVSESSEALRLSGKPASLSASDLVGLSDVTSPFDPLNPRPPLEIWSFSQSADEIVGRFIEALSRFFAAGDIRRLDSYLFLKASESKKERLTYESSCRYEKEQRGSSGVLIRFRCGDPSSSKQGAPGLSATGRLYVKGAKEIQGRIDDLVIGKDKVIQESEVAGGQVQRRGNSWVVRLEVAQNGSGMRPRRADGSAVESITLSWSEASGRGARSSLRSDFGGTVAVQVVDDFFPVRLAIDELAREAVAGRFDGFSSKPFRRAALMSALYERLGMPALQWCCIDDRGMPPPKADGLPSRGRGERPETLGAIEPAVKLFNRSCAPCHRTSDPTPPNFLHGDIGRVRAGLAQCAERIYFRLDMWRLDPQDRPKTPMPPIDDFRKLRLSQQAGISPAGVEELKRHVAQILKLEMGRDPKLEDLLERGYPYLRSCLPEAG